MNNCTTENVTSTSASVRCQAGWNGGLSQEFTLSVSHDRSHTRGPDGTSKKNAPRVLANTSSAKTPEFTLTGLEPGTKYILTIMAINKKGQSQPMRIAIETRNDIAEKRTDIPGMPSRTRVLELEILYSIQ